MLMRKLLMTITALGMTAGTLALAPGAANADPDRACFVDPNNNGRWYATADGNVGFAHFSAYDELLTVADQINNHRRAVARFSICVGGSFEPYRSYDSGPHEGDIDRERYDLTIAEGRRVRFKTCERAASGSLINCGPVEYAHA
jgi:hypothetical protein